MIHAKRMTKVRIIGPKSILKQVIDIAHDLKLIHVVDYDGKDFFEIGTPFEEAEFQSSKLLKVRGLIDNLKIKAEPSPMKANNAGPKLEKIHSEFTALNQKLSNLREQQKELAQKLSNPMNALGSNKEFINEYNSLAVFKGSYKKDFETDLESVTKDYVLYKNKAEKTNVFALFVPQKLREKVQSLLSNYGYSEMPFSDISSEEKLRDQLNSVETKIAELKTELNSFGKRNAQFLIDYELYLTSLNEKSEAPLKFATSKNAFVATGWIPTADLKTFENAIETQVHEKCYFETLKTEEDAPTALDNPGAVHPFEFFLNLYTLPKYYEFDPTILMFFTFPLFFGFMLGDVGYGLITGLLFLGLRTKMKGQMKDLLSVLLFASLSTIAFGFFFGEFFGYEFIEHPIINRVNDINTMLMVTILVGIIHINLGFIIGFYNKYVHQGFKHALYEKGSWILLEIGIIVSLLENFMGIQYAAIIGIPIILASLVMLYKGEGVQGFVELPALLSNALSYTRLFAVGLASVQLAIVVNMLAGQMFEAGGIMIIVAVFILLFGHAINIGLGILGPFLHSLRLHYVEFFGKFYTGGGERYTPFGVIRR
ncbi:MAG: V-type ATP synthase subunit I [Candidatus Diapherotrites archaeon]